MSNGQRVRSALFAHQSVACRYRLFCYLCPQSNKGAVYHVATQQNVPLHWKTHQTIKRISYDEQS